MSKEEPKYLDLKVLLNRFEQGFKNPKPLQEFRKEKMSTWPKNVTNFSITVQDTQLMYFNCKAVPHGREYAALFENVNQLILRDNQPLNYYTLFENFRLPMLSKPEIYEVINYEKLAPLCEGDRVFSELNSTRSSSYYFYVEKHSIFLEAILHTQHFSEVVKTRLVRYLKPN